MSTPENEFADMNSYLYWGGCMDMDRFDRDKMIWKYLHLDDICNDPDVCSLYKIRNKHEDFFKSLKDKVNDYDEFRKYTCNMLMIRAYKRMLENKNFSKSQWHNIREKYLKLNDPNYFYNYYLKEKKNSK